MNCHDFHDLLQRRLDDRVRPETDRELVRHTQQCEDCRGQLDVWKKVSSLMTSSPGNVVCRQPTTFPSKRLGGMAIGGLAIGGVAVAVILLFSVPRDAGPASRFHSNRSEPRSAFDSSDRQAMASKPSNSKMELSGWWQQVQGRDWVGQTMPTVRSVREGVAPLGRTLMRAVTILTIGGRDQAS